MAENFGDAYNSQVPGVHDNIAARSLHALTAYTKELQVRITPAQSLDELRAMHFA